MADEVNDTARNVRNVLQARVEDGSLFCPVSWGTLEELFLQKGNSLRKTAELMEQLSLNSSFIMRSELFKWEFENSLDRFRGNSAANSLKGLFTSPAAFVGSILRVNWHSDATEIADSGCVAKVQDEFRESIAAMGIVELAEQMSNVDQRNFKPPAYSEAANTAKQLFKGSRRKLFNAEAENCVIMYIRPLLGERISSTSSDVIPSQESLMWLAQFEGAGDSEEFYRRLLKSLPALYNHVDLMVEVGMQSNHKDSNNRFLDNEILVAPLAYADVFVSADKGIRNLLRNSNKQLLERTKCQYCGSLAELEKWLSENTN